MKTGEAVVARVLTIVLVLSGLSVAAQKNDPKPRLVLNRIKGPVTLDGKIDEPAWEGIKPFPMSGRANDQTEHRIQKVVVLDRKPATVNAAFPSGPDFLFSVCLCSTIRFKYKNSRIY